MEGGKLSGTHLTAICLKSILGVGKKSDAAIQQACVPSPDL